MSDIDDLVELAYRMNSSFRQPEPDQPQDDTSLFHERSLYLEQLEYSLIMNQNQPEAESAREPCEISLPPNIRLVIFSFVDYLDLLNVILALSKKDKNGIETSSILD